MHTDQAAPTAEAASPPKSRFSLRALFIAVTLFGIALALALPSILAARARAQRMSAMNNAKNIVLAMHNYLEQNKVFPAAVIRNAAGKPMLGWRFAILPFVESGNPPVYTQYDQRLPWDHPRNLALQQITIPLYVHPGQQNKVPHASNFVVITGPDTLFPDDGPASLGDLILDGTGNTIIIAEVGPSDIPWYEPRDLRIDKMSFRINDPDRSQPCIGNRRRGGAIVGWADGHVSILPDDTPPEKLRQWLTISHELIEDYSPDDIGNRR